MLKVFTHMIGVLGEFLDADLAEAATDLPNIANQEIHRNRFLNQVHTVSADHLISMGAVNSEKFYREWTYANGAFHNYLRDTGARLDFALRLFDSFTRAVGLSIQRINADPPTLGSGGPFAALGGEGGGDHILDRCLVTDWKNAPTEPKAGISDGSLTTGVGPDVTNCAIFQTTFGIVNGFNKNLQAEHNVVGNCNNAGFGAFAHLGIIIENNFGFGNGSGGDFDSTGSGATWNYNASADATADDMGGVGHLVSLTAADQIVSATPGSEDPRRKAGAALIGAGGEQATILGFLAVLPNLMTHDMEGKVRPQLSPDFGNIGCDEEVASFVASTNPQHTGSRRGSGKTYFGFGRYNAQPGP